MKGTVLKVVQHSSTSEMKEVLQHNVKVMQEALIRRDLRVNWKASKVLRVLRKSTKMTVNTCQRAPDLEEGSSRVHA